jgi:hypothetical protein
MKPVRPDLAAVFKVRYLYVNSTINKGVKAIGVSSQINVKKVRIYTFVESLLHF